MNKFMRESKGAISIFLVIVLLPMLTVASVFVDMARLNLAKSMAESAGDLTLNTALTNYDAEMKNLYGLFATSQDMEELMASLEDYYRDSIVAAGVDSAAADDYVGQIMDYLKTTTGDDDLMNIELTGFEVSVPAGGNLGNPAILKSQIVEFMKYRAPLSLGTGFLDALKTMKDLSKQTEMVEDKNKFYEKHQDLLGILEDAWWQIQLYQYADAKGATGFPTGSYLTDQGRYMAEDVKVWTDKNIPENLVKYLYRYTTFNSGRLYYNITMEYLCPECDGANASNKSECQSCQEPLKKEHKYEQWKLNWGGSTSVVNPYYSENRPATTDNVVEELNATLNAIAELKKYITGGEYSRAYDLALKYQNAGSTNNITEKIYVVCEFNDIINKNPNGNYLKKVKNLLECLVQLNAAIHTCDEEALSKARVTKIDGGNYKIEVSSSGGTPLASFADGNLSHLTLNQGSYLYYFNHVVGCINQYHWDAKPTVDAALSSINEIDPIRDRAYNYDKKLEEKIGNLALAITLLGQVRTSLSDPNSEYYKALEAWKTSAGNLSDSTMGKNDQAEIKELTSILTVDRVNAMITRLTNAKTTLEGIRSEIAKFEFANKSWKDIKDGCNLTEAKKLISSWDSQIKAVDPTAGGSYETIISNIEATVEKGNITDTWGESDKSPDLTDQQRELYTWMYNNFYKEISDYSKVTEPNETTSADGDMEDMETSLEKKAPDCEAEQTASTKVNRDISKYLDPALKALPSTRWSGTKDEIAAGKINTNADAMLKESNKDNDNILKTLLSIAANFGTELRDNMYVTEYIMSMFSYDTIEAEKYVEMKGSSAGFSSFYTGSDGGEYTVNDSFAEYAAEIKTMTNNSINPNMNYLYGGEVEYILYGDAGKAGVYGTIFVLRFALNTVYAFTDAEINNVTLAAATALFGTPPLTPLIPFAKAAMIIGLAIAESAWDLVQLRKGEAIPLMKSRENWVMSPSGLAKEVKDEIKTQVEATVDKAVDEVVDAGYQVLNKALTMTTEELQAYITGTENALGELASAATDTVKNNILNYANEALQEVVELCNAANQQMMLTTTISADYTELGATEEKVNSVINSLNDWLEKQKGDDPIVYEAKRIAVEYLTANGGALISEVFNTIRDQTKENKLQNGITTLLEEKLIQLQTRVESQINVMINKAGSKLNEYVSGFSSQLQTKLENAAKEGAESLKQTLSSEIDSAFGKIPESSGNASSGGAKSTTNAISSLLSWAYSDYLRVFVLIGLFANEELMLLRIADMIELNMQKKNNEYAVITTTETVTTSRFFGLWKTTKEKEVNKVNNEAFSLNNSYTYITIHATMQVKPLLLTMPFMGETAQNQLTGTNWYEIEYTGTLGY